MRGRLRASVGVLGAVILGASLAVIPVAGQGATAATATRAAKASTALRTAWRHPDLQGVWASNSATPLERPKQLEGRQFLTDEEVAVLQQRAAELFDGDTIRMPRLAIAYSPLSWRAARTSNHRMGGPATTTTSGWSSGPSTTGRR